jgi:hypothetical protein
MTQQTILHFKLRWTLSEGKEIRILGELPEFGENDISKAPVLKRANPNADPTTWEFEVSLPSNQQTNYTYCLILSEDKLILQKSVQRTITPYGYHMTVDDGSFDLPSLINSNGNESVLKVMLGKSTIDSRRVSLLPLMMVPFVNDF